MRASNFVYFALLALPSATFKVAVVEYTAVSPCGAGSCGKQQRESSCADYAEYVEQAGRAGASLVVFPEYGITGFSSYPKSSWVSGGYVEAVPAVPSGRRVVPCDSPSTFANAPSVVSLSCVAKKHGVAVVANLMDYDGRNMYNTDVALDTDGAFLAKYPKQNLWGERNVDIPQTCPMASFTTSFNVTFGLITCADLIYEFPASRLVRERHVEHFVMPAAWSDEMAQMQVLGFAQGWSLVHNVTLLLANHRTAAESGSGVWRGGHPLAYTFDRAPGADRLLVADVGAGAASAASAAGAASAASAAARRQEPPVTALADVPLTCATAVVGAGWAGIYAAWRLVVDAGALAPGDLCLFEARGKPGGRTYSVQVEGLVVDVGAYRFSKQQHLPSDLILERLELPTACYEPDCKPDAEFNQTLFKIVDTKGRNAGYVTPIRTMLAQLEAAGARVFFGHRLTGVYANGAAPTTRGGGSSGALTSAVSGSSSSLHFAGGQVVTASAVLLNLPRLVLQRLDPASIVFPTDTTQLSWQLLKNCTPCFDPSAGSAVPNWLAVKVYTQYDDPWWITKLGLEQGSFVDTEHSPPLVGRYHDGPVSRADDGSVDGPGLLEAVYAYTTSQPSIRYYEPFADDPAEDPLTITTDPALLLPLHRRLMEFHAAAFAKIGLNATRDVPPPTKVVLGIWTSDELAALPQPMSSNFRAQVPSCPAESCLDGVSAPQYNAATATPNPAANIHIANNDFAITLEQGVPCCWAEQSLKSVERTLHTAWGLGRPTWLDPEYYAQLLVAEETSDAPDAPEAIGVFDRAAHMASHATAAARSGPSASARRLLAASMSGASWAFAPLDVPAARVCSGGVCCSATVTSGSGHGYVLAALNGTDTDAGEMWASQVCAVLPCASASSACLAYTVPLRSASLRGLSMSMHDVAADTTLFPLVLAAAVGAEQRMLQPGAGADAFAFDAQSQTLNVAVADGLLSSATLYGRRFAADRLPYNC